MRSVLMALVVVWWCPLLLLPVLLGQQSQDNWDRNKHQGNMDKYDIFYPSVRSGSVQQQQQQQQQHQQSRHRSRRVRAVSEMDEADSFEDDSGGLVYRISAPVFFEDNVHLHLIPATDFISPGFVIQRVSGNYTWLEQIGQDPKLDCFFSGYVLGDEDSTVSLAMCDGMRGILYVRGEKYFIEPLKNSSVSLPLHQRPHIIYQPSSKNNTVSRCTSTENYKHHRLKHSTNGSAKNATNFMDSLQNSNHHHSRHKRSPGVSREHTVETLVVADSAMFQYHGSDLQQYVLTLMSIVGNIYRHPSINNYINVVVVKFIMFQTKQDMPFNVSYDATGSLREFCLWQHSILDHNSDEHHDTAILITRENICRELGKCDTLGLAELGTICDPLRSCSIIEDNGLSSAFTIAHELGHVFNLPHDDDAQCKDVNSISGRGGRRYHVMAPMLDANSSPWDWSPCSAHLMTEFIDAGLAECLRDAVKVNTLSSMVKSYTRPGWLYNADRQCHYIFGEGYGLCPYMNYPACGRLWCTNKTDSPGSGCRTQHMPWADGTQCGNQKMCQKGQCLMPSHDVKPVHGGWNSWSKYGPCSRTCGGGVKKQERLCNNPTPKDGGQFCLGQRTRYKSCNTQPCPAGSEDFRVEQCARYNGKVPIANLPPNAKWVPKYAGILMKDSCKLYCRVSHSSAYYQLDKKVEDGTKCGPFTDDICVNGQCWRAGCDNKLGSTMKRDRCGVCGGDNYTCRTVSGFFNNANYGYNHIITIPSGATEIDIRQHGHSYLADDDNYLALQNTDKEFILNGEFMVRTEKWVINVKGGLLDYSGSEENVERINSTRMIGEPIDVYVLSVGKLHPPNITYAYTVSTGDTVRFVWSNMGLWRKCSHVCRGKRRRKIVCVREDDNLIVSKKRCKGKGLKKPNRVEEPCNTECKLEWRVLNKGECSVRCGVGMRRQQAHCVKQTGFSQVDIVRDRECRRVLGAKPDNFVPCTGKCLPTFWSYTDWSQCSVSCGSGNKGRQARCVDEDGQELPDSECEVKDKVTSAACNTQPCPEWQTGDWLPCSATCGGGRKLRKTHCMQGEEKVNDTLCDSKLRPATRKECHLKECPEWYPGGWGPCSVTCDKGVSMRAVKCRLASSLLEDTQCDATKRPEDTQPCFMGACPTTPPLTTTTAAKTAPQAAFWRFGSWTECSATCGTGTKHRFVSCMDYQGQVINTSFCSHLSRPASVESCVIKPCGDWHSGAWSDCTVTCGEGIQTRYVNCILNEQITDESFCDIVEKPVSEHRCNRGTCISPDEGDFNVGVITSNRVEGSSRWLTWQWSACSATCGMGWQRRHVVCHDEKGVADTCDKSLKPDEYQACQGRPCPNWNAEDWQECSAKTCNEKGVQTRAVLCRLEGKVAPNSDCDVRQRPLDTRACEGACASPSNRWRTGAWSSCSVTCGRGLMQREVTCEDEDGNSLSYRLCRRVKPRNTKRCSAGPCPRWHKGKWSKCSATCGKGVKMREVACRNSQNEAVSPFMCPRDKQPKNVRPCQLEDCSQFVWTVGAWSECSKTCGFGQKHRPVSCKNRQGNEISSHLCDAKTKPKIKRRCAEFPCPFIWNTGPWSPCSATCGEGQQMRTVVCQGVTKEGWLLPGEVRDGCLQSEKPSSARYCNYGDCRAKNHWTVGPWAQCSAKCGFGQEQRQVVCVDKEKKQVSSSLCLRLYRPPRHRLCYNGPCYARSCKELKEMTTIRKDGDYQLQVGTRLVSIYCKDMRKSNPVEYLSLPAGEEANFAEVYGERLRRPAACPYNRIRPATCDLCRNKQYKQAGNTTYSKIRIDLNTLRLLVNDGEFSHVHTGKFIPFGTAGDCYSSSSCPQIFRNEMYKDSGTDRVSSGAGQFSISLVGTDFIVSVNTTWVLEGNEATQQIWRLRDGQIIRGLCGGYCGVCSPDHLTGLQLELLK